MRGPLNLLDTLKELSIVFYILASALKKLWYLIEQTIRNKKRIKIRRVDNSVKCATRRFSILTHISHAISIRLEFPKLPSAVPFYYTTKPREAAVFLWRNWSLAGPRRPTGFRFHMCQLSTIIIKSLMFLFQVFLLRHINDVLMLGDPDTRSPTYRAEREMPTTR